MKIDNRKAHFDYEILDKIEAGMMLSGAEVKSIVGGRAQLDAAYVLIKPTSESGKMEAWLVNANIPRYEFAKADEYDERRTRKLLLHKKELLNLWQKVNEKRLTVVPLALYTTGRLVKLSIGLARGRKMWQKRELLKKRDQQRDTQRELRQVKSTK
jgi:SsrA-binding protein